MFAGGSSGRTIAHAIKTEILELGLKKCRSQGFDAARNMSGKCIGTAKLIRTDYPQAIYIHMHCASHRLNLFIANACSIQLIKNVFGKMRCIYLFLNRTKSQKVLHHGRFSQKEGNWTSTCLSNEVGWANWSPRNVRKLLCRDCFSIRKDKEQIWWQLLSCIKFEFVIALVVTLQGMSYIKPATWKLETAKQWSGHCESMSFDPRIAWHHPRS